MIIWLKERREKLRPVKIKDNNTGRFAVNVVRFFKELSNDEYDSIAENVYKFNKVEKAMFLTYSHKLYDFKFDVERTDKFVKRYCQTMIYIRLEIDKLIKENNLEAAHLLARSAGGGSHPSNGIALERNMHWAFDRGFFTVTKDYKIKVHPEAMRITYLKERHGTKMSLPEDKRTVPNGASLEWHNKNVFGLFLRNQP